MAIIDSYAIGRKTARGSRPSHLEPSFSTLDVISSSDTFPHRGGLPAHPVPVPALRLPHRAGLHCGGRIHHHRGLAGAVPPAHGTARGGGSGQKPLCTMSRAFRPGSFRRELISPPSRCKTGRAERQGPAAPVSSNPVSLDATTDEFRRNCILTRHALTASVGAIPATASTLRQPHDSPIIQSILGRASAATGSCLAAAPPSPRINSGMLDALRERALLLRPRVGSPSSREEPTPYHAGQTPHHDRHQPKTTGQDPLEHRRPTARGDERGRFPRLHAVVPVPALPLGQLRDGGEEGTGAGLPRC